MTPRNKFLSHVDGEDANLTPEACLSIRKKGRCKNIHSNYDEICLTYLIIYLLHGPQSFLRR